MRSRYTEQLELLNRELIQMGSLCEEAIALSSKALTEGDTSLAKKVAPLDGEIDRMERGIESLCLKLLLQQQPVAGDLRQISAALKMITDMSRIGDQAQDIADIVCGMTGRAADDCREIAQMAEAACGMVTQSVDAFVQRDIALARGAVARDDEVDEGFVRVRRHLIEMIAEKPEDGAYAIDLLMIAKYLERIGDHAQGIAEWVIFSVTGVHEHEEEEKP